MLFVLWITFFFYLVHIHFLVPWITVKVKRTKSGSCLDVALYFLYIITNTNNLLFWWFYILKSFWQSLLSHMHFYISPAVCCSFCTSLKKQHIITFLLNFHFFSVISYLVGAYVRKQPPIKKSLKEQRKTPFKSAVLQLCCCLQIVWQHLAKEKHAVQL